jgi:hypothetical protein
MIGQMKLGALVQSPGELEEMMTLRNLLEEPSMRLAGSGLSFPTQRALGELDREMAPRQPPVGPGVGVMGRDDAQTQQWRGRAAPQQNRQLEELLRQREILRRRLRG